MSRNFRSLIISCALAPLLIGTGALADENRDPSEDDFEHRTDHFIESSLRLGEVEVFGNSGAPAPDGTLQIIPRLVVEEGTRKTARHGSYGFVIRPVIQGDNGIYELDRSRGRTHYTINSGLPTRSKKTRISVSGSKRFIPLDTTRNLRLPEGDYAISEVFYLVSRGPVIKNVGTILPQLEGNGIVSGSGFPGTDFPEIKRYCLSKTTLAFQIKAGETTSFDRLYLRGLPFKSRQWSDHDPILGTDKGLVKAGQIAFTKESEENQSKWMPIAFNAESGMCTNQLSVRTTGWNLPDPDAWGIPVGVFDQ